MQNAQNGILISNRIKALKSKLLLGLSEYLHNLVRRLRLLFKLNRQGLVAVAEWKEQEGHKCAVGDEGQPGCF